MAAKEFNPADYVFTPDTAVNVAVEQARKMEASHHRAMPIGLGGEIGTYFADMLPGQVCAVIAQSSNYKSGLRDFIISQQAKHLTDNGRDNEIIVDVSVEDTVEESTFMQMGKYSGYDAADIAAGNIQDWMKLEEAAIKIGDIPIYRVGESLVRPNMESELYLSNMTRAINYMVNDLYAEPLTVAAMHFDYLQAFPYDPEIKRVEKISQRRLQVREDIYRLRRSAQFFNCPVFVYVQAKQVLNNSSTHWHMPGMYDGEESSAIAQRVDRIVTLWMPKQTHGINADMMIGDEKYLALENLLWIKVAKQRGRLPAGKAWPCFIDYSKNEIEVSTVDELLNRSSAERVRMSNYTPDWMHE